MVERLGSSDATEPAAAADCSSDTEQDNDSSSSNDSDLHDCHNFGSFVDSDSCCASALADNDFVLDESVDCSSSCSECVESPRSSAVAIAGSFGG